MPKHRPIDIRHGQQRSWHRDAQRSRHSQKRKRRASGDRFRFDCITHVNLPIFCLIMTHWHRCLYKRPRGAVAVLSVEQTQRFIFGPIKLARLRSRMQKGASPLNLLDNRAQFRLCANDTRRDSTTCSDAGELGGLACTRFRRHRVRCFDGAGGGSWRGGSLHASSSLRRCA